MSLVVNHSLTFSGVVFRAVLQASVAPTRCYTRWRVRSACTATVAALRCLKREPRLSPFAVVATACRHVVRRPGDDVVVDGPVAERVPRVVPRSCVRRRSDTVRVVRSSLLSSPPLPSPRPPLSLS